MTSNARELAEFATAYAGGNYGMRNRIINGDMRIDQRNAGASVTASGAYPVDRFTMTNATDGTYTAQQDASAPSGFTNSVKITVGTADTSLTTTQRLLIQQNIEGFNVADLGWGAAGAQPVTVSFWVRSSLTGTFAGSLQNDARNRSYPFTYTINAADTWEQKSVTVAGDTTGTWVKNNGVGMVVIFALGVGPSLTGTAGAWAGSDFRNATGATSVVGTSGATFYITGVQLEAGSVATPFERRPYGTELQLCCRYFEKSYEMSVAPGFDFDNDQKSWFSSLTGTGTNKYINAIPFKVSKRVSPTLAFWDYNGVSGNWMTGNAGLTESTTAVAGSLANENGISTLYFATSNNFSYGFWTASAEL
jgi:hypothetical protein